MGKIVVLLGQSGAGKTTIANELGPDDGYLASCEILRNEVARRGLEDTHKNIHAIGMEFQDSDPSWQGKRVLDAAENVPFFVFDGPRTKTDIEFLQMSNHDVKVVGIYADRRIRYHRVLERENRDITKEQFMVRCIDEVIEAGLNDCLRLANIYLFNNGSSFDDIQKYSRLFWEDLKRDSIPDSGLYGLSSDDDMTTFEEKLRRNSIEATSSSKMCDLMKRYLSVEWLQLKKYKMGEVSMEEFL